MLDGMSSSESLLINDTSITITVKVLLFGDTCELTMLAVGGGGAGYGSGGGSGYIKTYTRNLIGDADLLVLVGEGGKYESGASGQSSVVWLNGYVVLGADAGQSSYSGAGGNGYCGGGGIGTAYGGPGGTDGGDGHDGAPPHSQKSGLGSGLKVDSIDMKNFVLG